MTDTANLGLPLIEASQAQKHVTHNEALVRLDALARLVVISRTVTQPPETVAEGAVYALPTGAVNAWSGQDGRLAIGSNGGWVFQTPGAGWRGWIADEGVSATFDGTDWRAGLVALGAGGSDTRMRVIEVDHVIAAGATATTALQLPQHGVVHGVTGRVIEAISGTLTGWKVGVAGAVDRYANGVGLAANSVFVGPSGTPVTYWADTALQLTAEGGDFAAGTVRLSAHVLELAPPDPVA